MSLFIVQYAYADAPAEERAKVRPRHGGYLTVLERDGILVFSGPYADATGALFLFRAEDQAACQVIVEGDPFWQAGFVAEWHAKEFLVGFGLPDESDRVIFPAGYQVELPADRT